MDWLLKILRSLFFFIDKIVYSLIAYVYKLFVDIANTTLFTDTMIDEFAGKLYYLCGIFMLFKVSFSILTYIVNPDEFADKNKGMGKMASNIVISLIMLVAVPYIFSEAMDTQKMILEENVIPKIFSTSNVSVSANNSNYGEELALITFEAFYSPGTSYTNTLSGIFGTDVNGNRAEYLYLISTVVGVVMFLLLVSFCFDVAVRSIKLGFLRLIAPIPIIGRVDPKKGNEIFNKWTKTCISTYLDLFMRLIAIYFALYIIKALTNSKGLESITGDTIMFKDSPLLVVFIILGALMFAKQLPKLLEDLLGINLGGGKFSLNPLKKLEDVPLAGKPLSSVTRFAGRTAGTLGRLAGAGIAASTRMVGRGIDNFTGNRISGARDAVTGWASGVRQNIGNGVNGFLGSHPNMQAVANRVGSDFHGIANDAQSTLYSAIGGIPGTGSILTASADRFDSQIKTLEEYAKFKSRLKEQADYDTESVYNDFLQNPNFASSTGILNASRKGVKGLKQYFEDLKNSGTATVDQITQARDAWEEAQSMAITSGSNNSISAIKAEAARYVQSHRDILSGASYSTSATASYDQINDGYKQAHNQIIETRSSAEYQTAQSRKVGVPPKGK